MISTKVSQFSFVALALVQCLLRLDCCRGSLQEKILNEQLANSVEINLLQNLFLG